MASLIGSFGNALNSISSSAANLAQAQHNHKMNQMAMAQSQIANTTMVAAARRNRKYTVFFEERRAGYRVPDIDKKLAMLASKAKALQDERGIFLYYNVSAEEAIEALGKYNPMYSNRPKKLAKMLLEMAASSARGGYGLVQTGLVYPIPMLIGVRASRHRATAAALGLLDYWAGKFPKFAPFVDAYVHKKGREEIIVDCVDMAMGNRPVSFRSYDERNKLYQLKADSRELKRMKKEQEEKEALRKHHEMMQLAQQSMYPSGIDPYQHALGSGYKNALTPYLQGQSAGIANPDGSVIWKNGV